MCLTSPKIHYSEDTDFKQKAPIKTYYNFRKKIQIFLKINLLPLTGPEKA